MQDKTWYSIFGLDAEPLFLQDHMLSKNLLDFTIPDHDTPQLVLKGKIMVQKIHPRGVIWGAFFPPPVVFFKKIIS